MRLNKITASITEVTGAHLTAWFSYSEPFAFRYFDHVCVSEPFASVTTARHIAKQFWDAPKTPHDRFLEALDLADGGYSLDEVKTAERGL